MKIRNFVFGMLTCAAFTACTNEEIVDNNGGAEKLEGEAYVAINIVTPSITSTRAAGDFEAGTGTESEVKSATFLFYDATGTLCAHETVDGSKLEKWKEGTTESIEKISAPVLLLNPVNGAIPTSVIAILNASEKEQTEYLGMKLSLIKGLVGNGEVYKNGFYMTNSVYGKNNEKVIEVPLTIENLATSAKDAESHPVKIPVERVVARVDLSKEVSESAEQIIKMDGKDVTVKAVIKGWKVTATNPDSYLLKQIDMTWDQTFNPWNWNDETNTRSYWAKSATPTKYNFYSYNDAIANTNNSEYCLENTSAAWDKLPNYSTATKLWVVAQLINTADNKPLSLMEWRGSKTTPDGVKALMANMLKKYYYVADGTANVPGAKYETIKPGDLKFVDGSVHYKAKAALATPTKKFYTLVTNADKSITATEATADLITEMGKLPEAQAWTDGMTYYYTNIEHAGTANDKIYGVVRNHIYKLNITKISGIGTPIFNPETEIDPTKPSKEDASYVAAEVQVLKWKVVKQDVELN